MSEQRPPQDQLVFVNRALRTSVANLKTQLEEMSRATAAARASMLELIEHCRERASDENAGYYQAMYASPVYRAMAKKLTRLVDGE
jgi:hypothetical protein